MQEKTATLEFTIQMGKCYAFLQEVIFYCFNIFWMTKTYFYRPNLSSELVLSSQKTVPYEYQCHLNINNYVHHLPGSLQNISLDFLVLPLLQWLPYFNHWDALFPSFFMISQQILTYLTCFLQQSSSFLLSSSFFSSGTYHYQTCYMPFLFIVYFSSLECRLHDGRDFCVLFTAIFPAPSIVFVG